MDSTESYIDYDRLVQNALRSVVRQVLIDAADDGLQGEHHFFIAFKTQAPGVDIPARLVSRFPDEMTIVLQHRFWGLEVFENHFHVGLSFDGQPETLVITFDSVVGFVDPSVQFALQFQDHSENDSTAETPPKAAPLAPDMPGDGIHDAFLMADSESKDHSSDENEATDDDNKVVTLDAFRKK